MMNRLCFGWAVWKATCTSGYEPERDIAERRLRDGRPIVEMHTSCASVTPFGNQSLMISAGRIAVASAKGQRALKILVALMSPAPCGLAGATGLG
jgi:hypothetical protein